MKEEFLMSEVKFSHLRKLNDWAWYIKGARDMLVMLRKHCLCDEPHYESTRAQDKIYNKAILDLIVKSKANIDYFLMEKYGISFTDHERDKKGKLVKCRAYFSRKVVKYDEVK